MNTEEYILLVYKNLKGELSSSEFDHLNKMTATDSALATLRMEIEDAWDVTGDEVQIVSKQDTENLINKIKDTTSNSSSDATTERNENTRTEAKVFPLMKWISGVAAILFFGLAAVWLMQDSGTMYDTAGVYTLADKSTVTLREGSTLKVYKFDDSQRKVDLRGEAYFDIEKNENVPFVVAGNHVKIQVLGTSFLVKEKNGETYIDLIEGKISTLDTRTLDTEILTAGMKVKHTTEGKILPIDAYGNLSGWKDGVYQFESSTLGAVLEEFSIIFDTEIQMSNEALSACKFSGTLVGESLEDLLRRIAKMYKMQVKQDGTNWILDGEQCN